MPNEIIDALSVNLFNRKLSYRRQRASVVISTPSLIVIPVESPYVTYNIVDNTDILFRTVIRLSHTDQIIAFDRALFNVLRNLYEYCHQSYISKTLDSLD